MTTMQSKEVEVLVVGSGAGGMMAALVAADQGADVLIVEKDAKWGGTSATSGAGIWIPGSSAAAAAGFDDDLEAAFTYIRGLAADNVPDENIRAYVNTAASMLDWLMAKTEVRYFAAPYPDYHAENPGGSAEGFRTHMPMTLDGRALGEDIRTQRFPSPAASLFGRINWDFAEFNSLLYRTDGWWWSLTKAMANYYFDLPFRLTSGKDRRLTLGNALTGGLRLALNERSVPLWLEAPMTSLLETDGRITGAVVERGGKPVEIRASKGVVLAAGGFDKNQEMRDDNAPDYPSATYSGGVTSNTGDSIRAGRAVGAKTLNMHSAWAAPVFYLEGEDRGRLCTIERALPGCILVSQSGKRFLNEAASYHIVGQQMARREREHGDASPSWLIFDARYRHLYPVGPLYPLIPDWLQGSKVKRTMRKAATLGELATKLGIQPDELEATVARFNEAAARGEDPEFERGKAAYDRMYGDPRQSPNPCLRPIDKAPFYAMPMYPGDIGTNGGLMTNEHAQVLDENDAPIPGLYAVGNTAASAMGESYPGAGVTIGPALTFGYIAAGHMLGRNM